MVTTKRGKAFLFYCRAVRFAAYWQERDETMAKAWIKCADNWKARIKEQGDSVS